MDSATRHRLKLASAALALFSAATFAAVSQAAPAETYATVDRSGGERFPAKPSRPAPSKKINDDDGGPQRAIVPQTVLAPLKLEALLAEDERTARTSPNKILRAGIGRAVRLDDSGGNWYDTPSGRLWLGEIVSPGAFGLRVQFAQLALPKNAELAVTLPGFAEDAERVEWVEADPRLRGEIFAPLIPGERVRIEYFAPNGSFSPADYLLPFRVVGVQHFYRNPLDGDAYGPGSAAGCQNDVSCSPTWNSVSKGVSRATFVKNGSSYLCSGQLINSLAADLTPYWLTANHCVPSQQVASTVQFFWRYQTLSCNGMPPLLATVQSSTGATLVSGGAASDYSLLMVEGGLPSGLTWVGWTAAPAANGTASASIHHPSGDYKRISFGSKALASSTSCGGESHVRVSWTDGATESGSSGAGLFRADTQQLYGQLHCGSSACGNESGDDYGAFSATYPKIASHLAGGSDDATELNDSCGSARVLAAGTYSNRVVKSTDADWYAISVPAGKTFTATLGFSHLNGDIDAAIYAACGGAPIAVGAGTGNTEMMTVTNRSGAPRAYYVHVFLYADTRNTYSMTLDVN